MNKRLKLFWWSKNDSFTLAETLIVMGIIGVVAAITLPNLNSSTGDKERVAKVKKIYQNLNDALGRAVAVYGPYDEWFINDPKNPTARSKRAGERITEFMKVQKDCAQNDSSCFTSVNIKYLNGSNGYVLCEESYKIITADGMSVSISSNAIEVDIDGPNKGPYTLGKDYFIFVLDPDTKDGNLIPCGAHHSNWMAAYLSLPGYGVTAAWWILNYDNADYLKLDSDEKCPDGTELTETHTRCK